MWIIKKESEILRLFSVFRLLHTSPEGKRNFKQKLQNPNLFPITGLCFRRLPPAYIVLVGYRLNPTVSALGTENPSPVSLAYPSTQKVQCKLLLPADFRLAKRLFVTYIAMILFVFLKYDGNFQLPQPILE